MSLIPYVIGQTGRSERSHSIYPKSLRRRITFLDEGVSDVSASPAVAQFLSLESEDSGRNIHLYINSLGGSASAGFTIYDTMSCIGCDVSIVYVGMVASVDALLLFGGAKGKRFVLPNAEIMIHQPSGRARGQATEIKIVAESISKTRKKLDEILVTNAGRPLEVIEHDTERDSYISALGAKEYDLIDGIVAYHQCCGLVLRHQAGNAKQQVKDMKGQVSYTNETR